MLIDETDPDFAPILWVLPAPQRVHLQAIAAFVRLSRSTAPGLPVSDAIAQLRALASAIDKPSTVLEGDAYAVMADLRDALAASGASPSHAHRFLQARERELTGWRAETWSEVLAHCQDAAAAIGRLILEICGEDVRRGGRSMDALSAALWMLYAMRDLDGDAPGYPPPCIPRRFLTDAMISLQVSPAGGARGQVRAVLDRVLDGIDRLVVDARLLPRLIANSGLRWHCAVALCRAGKIASELRHRDPFYEPVRLTGAQRWLCLCLGFVRRVLRR